MSFGSFYTSATGMFAANDRLAVTGNNIANLSTVGYKQNSIEFADIFYSVSKIPGGVANATTGVGISYGTGTRVASTPLDMTPGPFLSTGQPLDAYISDPSNQFASFFTVLDVDGNTLYTRRGDFLPNAVGAVGPLHLESGGQAYIVQPQIDLVFDPAGYSITSDGRVVGGTVGEVGQLQLARFINPEGLEQVGDTFFAETAASGTPTTGVAGDANFSSTAIVSGGLEESNVQFVEQTIELITSSQSFQINSEGFRAANGEILTTINLAANT